MGEVTHPLPVGSVRYLLLADDACQTKCSIVDGNMQLTGQPDLLPDGCNFFAGGLHLQNISFVGQCTFELANKYLSICVPWCNKRGSTLPAVYK